MLGGEGGSGKSTFVKALHKYYEGNSNIFFLQEPVNIWESIKNELGENIIQCFYSNQEKYAFSLQMMAYISRLSLLKKAVGNNYKYIITERCVFTDRNVFAKMLFDSGKMEKINFEIYNRWFDEFINEFNNFKYIYIKTDPYTAYDRVNKRSRIGETIPIEYLEQCNNYHNDWLNSINSDNITVFDGNIERNNNDLYNDWITIINNIKLIDIKNNIPSSTNINFDKLM